MNATRPRSDIVDDISLLYELSLAVGTSLDLEDNCAAFIKTLVTRKNLDLAAVWLHEGYDAGENRGTCLSVASAFPSVRVQVRRLPADHPFGRLEPGTSLSLQAGDEAYAELLPQHEGAAGACALFALGHLGFLQLVSRRRTRFSERERNQLRSVLRSFTTSLEGCLAHRQLQAEVRERRRTARRLRATTSRLGALIENMQSGVMVEDESSQIVLINEAFCDIFGMETPPSALVGLDCTGTARKVASLFGDPEGFVAGVDRAQRNRTVEMGEELIMKDGRVFERDYVPIFVEDAYRGHLWQYRDVTDRKRTEAELRRAKRVAEESAQAKERFLADMSHEIRTPLNAVIGTTHLLRQTEVDDGQVHYLNNIQHSADNLLALINDLLDFAKVEADRVEFEAVPFDLDVSVQQLYDTMRMKAEQKGLEFEVELHDDLPASVVGDPTRLSQILLNLVSNAIKFTEEGRVEVRAYPVDGGDSLVRFEVQDTGIGIPEDQLDRIFESFTQARSDTTRKYGGTGLGLAIVKELTERQGGHVDVVSREGEGTTFTVTLPLAKTDAVPAPGQQPDEPDVSSLEGASILLAEDNEMNQIMTARMLRQWGAEVDAVADGRDAVARVAQGSYDLVLMDIQMPGMDGTVATRRIRDELGRMDLPILALTAASFNEPEKSIEAAGMDGVVFKPFEPDELRRCIARHLNGSSTAPSPAAAPPDVDLALLERNAFDDAFVAHMVDLFLDQAPQQLGHMRSSASEEDWEQVRRASHKLKSSAAMLGAGELQRLLARVEDLVDDGSTDAVPTALTDALARASDVIAALKERRAVM